MFSCAPVRLSGMRDGGTVTTTTARGDAATRGELDDRCAPPPSPFDFQNSCPPPFRLVFVLEVGQSPPHVGGAPLTSYYTRPRCPNPDAQTRKVNEGVVGGGPSVLIFCATPVARSQDPDRAWVPGVLVFGCVGWVRNP